jgi:predicted unusual protein kinase regulating ubiquinone biosynthesis (AarF/ABC1/UbiB family)
MRWGRIVIGSGLATLGTAAALWRRRATRLSRGATGGPVSHHSRFQRNAKLATVGARAGRDFARHRATRTFASAARKEELDRAFEIRTAEQVTEALGQMKGALMKLGQMVSYLDQGLPEHVRDALAQLQQDAPPMSAELAAGVIREELGAAPEEIFATWDPVPIASASIGQVHRAMTHAGHAVAVKVQYPGVDRAVSSDLDSVGLVFAGMGQLFPGLDPKPIVAELRERLIEELDYRNEARNQQLFADYYRDHAYIDVPAVHPQLSTARALTTDLAEGVPWSELLTWSQEERNLAAETLLPLRLRLASTDCTLNGDPTPATTCSGRAGT